jgi:quercetin dioxygenase-like cupin family protein
VPGAEITVGLVEIDAGMSNPVHYHPNCEEVLHLLEGSLDHRIGDDVVSITGGDTIHVPQGIVHGATNTGTTTARMLVAYPTGQREMVVVDS